jgi:hypothetical protein
MLGTESTNHFLAPQASAQRSVALKRNDFRQGREGIKTRDFLGSNRTPKSSIGETSKHKSHYVTQLFLKRIRMREAYNIPGGPIEDPHHYHRVGDCIFSNTRTIPTQNPVNAIWSQQAQPVL